MERQEITDQEIKDLFEGVREKLKHAKDTPKRVSTMSKSRVIDHDLLREPFTI